MAEKDAKKVFADNLIMFLEKSGITSSDLADRLEVSKATISQWLHLRTYPTIEKLEIMARIFGCNITDLMLPPEQVAKELRLTDKEQNILIEYRKADTMTREMVNRLLAYAIRLKDL